MINIKLTTIIFCVIFANLIISGCVLDNDPEEEATFEFIVRDAPFDLQENSTFSSDDPLIELTQLSESTIDWNKFRIRLTVVSADMHRGKVLSINNISSTDNSYKSGKGDIISIGCEDAQYISNEYCLLSLYHEDTGAVAFTMANSILVN